MDCCVEWNLEGHHSSLEHHSERSTYLKRVWESRREQRFLQIYNPSVRRRSTWLGMSRRNCFYWGYSFVCVKRDCWSSLVPPTTIALFTGKPASSPGFTIIKIVLLLITKMSINAVCCRAISFTNVKGSENKCLQFGSYATRNQRGFWLQQPASVCITNCTERLLRMITSFW